MGKKEKKSRKFLDDSQSRPQRSTRSRTQEIAGDIQLQNEIGLQVKEVPEKSPNTSKAEVPDLLMYDAVELTASVGVRSQRMNRSLEENLLAFLDGSATADPDEILEDKMMFLEATHSMCVVPNLAHIPTPKMCRAILQFIQECHYVGLTMSSFELLSDLEKRHPRVTVTEVTSPDSGLKRVELFVDKKVWSQIEETCEELAMPDRHLVTNSTTEVSTNIFILLETIARRLRVMEKPDRDGSDWGGNYVVLLSQFMMLQHLMSLIQTDVHCRLKVFDFSKEDKDFTVVQESYIYRLLCSSSPAEKKSFMMNLNSMMCCVNLNSEVEGMDALGSGKNPDLLVTRPQKNQEGQTAALLPSAKDFGRLASDLLVLVMNLDTLNQEFGVPTSLSRRRNRLLFDTLLSICTKASTLDAYLKAVSDPIAKLKFAVAYFVNFAPKQASQGLVGCTGRESMDKLLSCFTDPKTLKSVVKVFKDAYALPVLLSHAFQAFLLLHSLDDGHSNEQVKNSLDESRTRVCKSIIIALDNLKSRAGRRMMQPIVEETSFVATRISDC